MVAPTMAPPPMVVMRAGPPLLNIHSLLLLGGPVPMRPSHQRGDEKEDTVHDAKRKSGLEHSARLVHTDVDAIDARRPKDSKRHVNAGSPRDVGAVCARDEPQVIHAGYKRTDKGQVDEAHKARVVRGPVVREESEQRPRQAKGRDDEEDQDVIRRKHVGVVVPVDEPG